MPAGFGSSSIVANATNRTVVAAAEREVPVTGADDKRFRNRGGQAMIEFLLGLVGILVPGARLDPFHCRR